MHSFLGLITGGQWGLRKTVYLALGRKGHESFYKERREEESVTAGYGGWTGSEGSGNGSQTPWRICSPHSGGHTPWCTGIHDSQGTGSTRTCRTRIEEQRWMENAKGKMTQKNPNRYSRSGLNMHRAHFIVAPSHSLKRGVVVTELSLAAQIVLPIIDSHSALPVVLDGVILNKVSQLAFFFQCKPKIRWINCNQNQWGEIRRVGSVMYDVVLKLCELTAHEMGLKEVILSMW